MANMVLFPFVLLLMAFGATNSVGITRQLDQMLPNNERISRSVHYPIEDDAKPLETMPFEDNIAQHRHVRSANSYDLDTAENNVVFRPLFRKKPKRVLRSVEDDLATAESHVFKPLFRRPSNKRVAREIQEDMETAENNIVFRPQFRKKGLRRIRSLDDIPIMTESPNEATTPKTEDQSNDHDVKDDELAEAKRHIVRRDVSQDGGELMETAANTIVFRPLFRSNKRNFNRQRN